MEKIDLSTNSKHIQDSYNKVVRGDGSTTYAVFSVDKNGVLDATASGSGDLSEFVEEFTDGHVQFGLARVSVPGSDVFKNLLLGWCPDNAPVKLRMSFASNFADVSRVLSGYHVQITARDQDDLDVDEFVARVAAAAGANYSAQTLGKTQKSAPKPAPAAVKPAPAAKPAPVAAKKPASFVPKTTGKPIAPVTPKPVIPKPASFSTKTAKSSDNDDEWGGEKEIEERDFERQPLESVPSAYKPTKVDIDSLRKQKSDTISSTPKPSFINTAASEEKDEPAPLKDRMKAYESNDGRLTSLPKPKISNSVASRFKPAVSSGPSFGAKPTFGAPVKKEKPAGGISRNFGSENGKTPAQLWAEKRGKYKDVSADEDLAEKTASLSVEQEPEEPEQEPEHEEPEEEPEHEEEEEEEEKPQQSLPSVIKPINSFAAPPKRNLPPAPAVKEEEEEEEEEEEAPTPSLPARGLPPLPGRSEEPAPSLPSRKEEPAPSLPSRTHEEPKEEPKAGVKAVAQYDYEKDEDNEIGFAEGDLIVEIEFVDEEWWSGKHVKTGEVGLFPGSYVSIKEDDEEADEAPEASPKEEAAEEETPATGGNSAVAEYDYEKDEDNEISFAEGDLIVEIEFVDEDWWSGKNSKTGEVGLFPANYVKLQ
ncbi:putative actin-binding protein [Clavispora lusitaniae]|uniref:Actin-binding protein n=1 Tax=Clavispora lusitaniae TaxID=36911 RepID=A0AA91Q2X7_CLALS|nr:putative actin-binding protein [Clavispora lusitaniae]